MLQNPLPAIIILGGDGGWGRGNWGRVGWDGDEWWSRGNWEEWVLDWRWGRMDWEEEDNPNPKSEINES